MHVSSSKKVWIWFVSVEDGFEIALAYDHHTLSVKRTVDNHRCTFFQRTCYIQSTCCCSESSHQQKTKKSEWKEWWKIFSFSSVTSYTKTTDNRRRRKYGIMLFGYIPANGTYTPIYMRGFSSLALFCVQFCLKFDSIKSVRVHSFFYHSLRHFDILDISLVCSMEDAKRPRDNSSDDDDNSKRQKTESKISTSLL